MANFSVSDRGIGIKEENIEKIFQKFTQLDSGVNRKYGGKIYVESKFREGSIFIFSIPLKDIGRRKNK